jgi:hypothetical protein
MKSYKSILTAVFAFYIVLSFNPNAQAQDFEGIIYFETPSEGSQMGELAYKIKGSKVRMEMGEGQQSAAIIYQPEKSESIVLINQMKAYMKMDMNDEEKAGQNLEEWENSTLDKSGKRKTIAGHSCEIWEVENENGEKYTLCMAQGLGTFMTPGNPMNQKNAPAWAKMIAREGYMPLEVIKTDSGTQKVQMRATKIERKSLDDALFKIPEGYRDMSGMMNKMQKND